MVGEKKWVPYALLVPWLFGFILFKVYPFISSFVMSLYETRGRVSTFVGLKNFQLIFDGSSYLGSEIGRAHV